MAVVKQGKPFEAIQYVVCRQYFTEDTKYQTYIVNLIHYCFKLHPVNILCNFILDSKAVAAITALNFWTIQTYCKD